MCLGLQRMSTSALVTRVDGSFRGGNPKNYSEDRVSSSISGVGHSPRFLLDGRGQRRRLEDELRGGSRRCDLLLGSSLLLRPLLGLVLLVLPEAPDLLAHGVERRVLLVGLDRDPQCLADDAQVGPLARAAGTRHHLVQQGDEALPVGVLDVELLGRHLHHRLVDPHQLVQLVEADAVAEHLRHLQEGLLARLLHGTARCVVLQTIPLINFPRYYPRVAQPPLVTFFRGEEKSHLLLQLALSSAIYSY